MTLPDDLGRLAPHEWEHLQDLADRFEEAWQRNESIDWERYLPPAGDRLRPVALHELIKIDLEIRQRRHQGRRLEAYLQQFPELGQPKTLSPRLIYEEYRTRQLYGDKPPLTEYENRFPH